jgi:hypothetical protein
MTESKTENASRADRLAWQNARRLWGVGQHGNSDTWPDAFEPGELAAMQYPREGTDAENKVARRQYRAMLDELKRSIQAGEIETVTVQRMDTPIQPLRRRVRTSPYMDGIASEEWRTRDSKYASIKPPSPKPETHEYQAITRPAFAAWLRLYGFSDDEGGKPISEYIRAWLGPEWVKSAPTRQDPSHYFDAPPMSPLPRVTMRMMEAGDLAGFDARNGWPDAFTPKELAALQYPGDRPAQGRLIAMLAPRLDVDIPAVTVMRYSPVGIIDLDRPNLEPWPEYPEGAVERGPAAHFLDDIGEEPSRYVMAWFESEGAGMKRGNDTPAIRPKKSRPKDGKKAKPDRLDVAMQAGLLAYRAKHKTTPTADAFFDWLPEHDETGSIVDANEFQIWWKKGDSDDKPIKRKTFRTRFARIKDENPE